ncbi:MAG TPA: FAD-dependent monooxygenase [Stellaceae bacterium]|nr:FAD-dependent monooxygenase [Stellaceae bacterium]
MPVAPSTRVAVIGAGVGGLAAASALMRLGLAVDVFEQAEHFQRIGTAINLTPNAVKVVDGLGLGAQVRDAAFRPTHRVSRTFDTGAETSRLEMSGAAERRYGAPQLTMHRADLLAALEAALPPGAIRLGKRLIGLTQNDDGVSLAFADGTSARAAAVIGADGIHSTVRELAFGKEAPRFAGMVGYRGILPARKLQGYDAASFIKWWGPTQQSMLITFLINRGEDLYFFATRSEERWRHESWSSAGDVEELRAAYADYHPDARSVLERCDEVLMTALYERDPLPHWTRDRVSLLGDACHPMMPFMAQGAAMGLEDAAMLARAFESESDVRAALARYEEARIGRASTMQLVSRENEFLRTGVDADWVYGYDAWRAPLPSA